MSVRRPTSALVVVASCATIAFAHLAQAQGAAGRSGAVPAAFSAGGWTGTGAWGRATGSRGPGLRPLGAPPASGGFHAIAPAVSGALSGFQSNRGLGFRGAAAFSGGRTPNWPSNVFQARFPPHDHWRPNGYAAGAYPYAINVYDDCWRESWFWSGYDWQWRWVNVCASPND